MFGLLALDPDRIAQLATAILSVLGGYLAGFIITGVSAYFLDRWLTGGKSLSGMHTTAKHVGGVAGAVLVALMVFGGLGDGTGPGGDGTATSGTAGEGGSGSGPPTPTTSMGDLPPAVAPPIEPEKPAEEAIQVLILSGTSVRNERFYQVGDESEPTDLAGVKERVRAKRIAPGSLSIAVRLGPRTDRNNSGVLDLETWARENGMRVILPRKE